MELPCLFRERRIGAGVEFPEKMPGRRMVLEEAKELQRGIRPADAPSGLHNDCITGRQVTCGCDITTEKRHLPGHT